MMSRIPKSGWYTPVVSGRSLFGYEFIANLGYRNLGEGRGKEEGKEREREI